MSQALYAGTKAGVPVLKVMASDVDDPLTTPNNRHGKFRFNSEVQKVGYLSKILTWDLDSNQPQHWPPGTNNNTCQIWSLKQGNTYQMLFFQEFFGMPFLPIVEFRGQSKPVIDRFSGPIVTRLYKDAWNGTIESDPGFYSHWQFQPPNTIAPRGRPFLFQWMDQTGATFPNRLVMSVWNLPADDSAILDHSATPIPGQEVIRIGASDGGVARVALPGRTISDTDPDHYILHEDHIPAKVMASGQIDLAVDETATISCPFDLPPSTYMDFHIKRTDAATFWVPPYINSDFFGSAKDQQLSLSYETEGSDVLVTNDSQWPVTLRYAVFADSGDEHTTGGNKVLFTGNDGEQDYIQIKRPGSSDSDPSLNDIMLDTRLSYLPLLAEGFLTWPDDFPTAITGNAREAGERKATVTFDNPDGLLPLIKCGVLFEQVEGNAVVRTRSSWGGHTVQMSGNWRRRCLSYSTAANIIDDSTIEIYAAGDNPATISIASNTAETVRYNAACLGVRYYIFGIPADL